MGTLNPNAPRELANFSFLVGSWKCVVSILQPDGTRVNLNAEWTGQYILDGYAIADKYTMHDPEGKLLVCGMNFRSYNLKKNDWNMKWFEALTSTWLDLGPQELGGVEIGDSTITFKVRFSSVEIQKIAFSNISNTHFDWAADISKNNGKTWDESAIRIRAERVNSITKGNEK